MSWDSFHNTGPWRGTTSHLILDSSLNEPIMQIFLYRFQLLVWKSFWTVKLLVIYVLMFILYHFMLGKQIGWNVVFLFNQSYFFQNNSVDFKIVFVQIQKGFDCDISYWNRTYGPSERGSLPFHPVYVKEIRFIVKGTLPRDTMQRTQ